MTRRKIVHLNLPPVSPELARRLLAPLDADLVVARCITPDEVVEVASDADAIIGAALGRLLTPDVLDRLERLRLVSLWSGSTDYLDLDALTDHGVCVCFGADACTDEVADHGMALMLAAARRLPTLERLARAHPPWTDHDQVVSAALPMHRLSACTVGCIGFGRAGAALAARCRGFGSRFVAHDPYVDPARAADLGVELVSLEAVLRESDFVHIYVPMRDDTVAIVGAPELALMKPTAWIVNSSARSTVIDEEALHAALTSGRLAGAALDDLARDPEDPTRPNPLLALDNVIVTPHVSHVSDQSYEAMQQRICSDVVGYFEGRWPELIANPAVRARPRR